MKNKAFVVLVALLMLVFSGCGVFDEMKGLSVYSDFLFAFQDHWETESPNMTPVAGGPDDPAGAEVYEFTFDDTTNITGKLGNVYTGTVRVVNYLVAGNNGEDNPYFDFSADLDVASTGLTPVGATSEMVIEANCLVMGLILDGYVLLRNEDPDVVPVYTQAANLEGLYILLKREIPAAE